MHIGRCGRPEGDRDRVIAPVPSADEAFEVTERSLTNMCVKLNTEQIAILLCINPSRTIWTTATCEATDWRLFAMARKTQSLRMIKAGSRGYWTTYLETGGQYAIEMEAPRFGITLHILEKKDQSMAEKHTQRRLIEESNLAVMARSSQKTCVDD